MEQVNLNIVPNGVKSVCHASQYDMNRQFRLNLFEGDSAYSLSGTETIELNVRKTDGTVYTSSIANTSSNYLIISTAQQMTAAPGDNECNIKITNGNTIIGTLNFVLSVEVSPLDGGMESVSYIYNLEQQIEDILSHMPLPPSTSIKQFSGSMNTIATNVSIVEYEVIT